MNATQTKKVGDKVQLKKDLHKTHGDYYFRMNGIWGVIVQIDAPDEDGEQVYSMRTGNRGQVLTITETMIR